MVSGSWMCNLASNLFSEGWGANKHKKYKNRSAKNAQSQKCMKNDLNTCKYRWICWISGSWAGGSHIHIYIHNEYSSNRQFNICNHTQCVYIRICIHVQQCVYIHTLIRYIQKDGLYCRIVRFYTHVAHMRNMITFFCSAIEQTMIYYYIPSQNMIQYNVTYNTIWYDMIWYDAL